MQNAHTHKKERDQNHLQEAKIHTYVLKIYFLSCVKG